MAEKRPICSGEAATRYGILAEHEQMPNGELRFRLFGPDQNGYIRTVASDAGGWQRSHVHSTFRELYLVESGWMAMAVARASGDPDIRILGPGEVFVSPIGQTHNVYLPAKAVIHTIKFGIHESTARFEPRPEFDPVTHCLTENDIKRLASPQSD